MRRPCCACWCADHVVPSACRPRCVWPVPRGGFTACVRVQTLLLVEAAALGPGAHGCVSLRPATAPPRSVGLSAPGSSPCCVQGAHRAPKPALEARHRLGLGVCFPRARTRLVSSSGLLSTLASTLGFTLSIWEHASRWFPRTGAWEPHLWRRLAVFADVFIRVSDNSWFAGPTVVFTQTGEAGRHSPPASSVAGEG